MKILNLTDIETSDIKFEVSKFPDGQNQIKILKSPVKVMNTHNEFVDLFLKHYEVVQIKSRLNNFKDLELIICATKSLRELGVKEIHLYTPYFLGSRSDRKFEEGSNNYLKDVICPIINSLNFKSVTVLDPHSDVLEACLNNFKKVDNKQLVLFAAKDLYSLKGCLNDNSILISPDAGANKKIFKIAEQIGYTGDIITCSKSRDENGKLSHVVIPEYNQPNKDLIIIDDICDGGATFINIAKTLKEYKHHKGKIYLIVTHGIFSKGFKELNKYFDGIYCTNSYRDVADNEYEEKTNVKQLNVF
jgi:ribose-phosphate pyrophosphokinase